VDERELTILELARRIGFHNVRYDGGPVSSPASMHGHSTETSDATAIPRDDLRAELHFRLARAFAIPFIPLLAVALAIGAKRRRPVLGLLALAFAMIAFDHTLQFGRGLMATRSASRLS